MKDFIFHKVDKKSDVPYELLLLADETREAVDRYIFNSDVYILNDNIRDIAVMALCKNSDKELEIKNMAVISDFRSQGIGTVLIDKAKEIARQNHFYSLIVGTSDTGFQQIRFYERNGFVKKEIRKDFFIQNYPTPIFENGIQMRDMIILEFLIHHLPE